MKKTLPSRVTVRAPGTSANLGSGFDCIGMAVDLWNTLTVEHAPSFSVQIQGEGADVLPRTEENFVVLGVKMAYDAANMPMPPLAYFCENGIPYGSGLGSSSAAIVSGLLAGLVLTGQELKVAGKEELLQIAATVEGHTDNLAPCIYGGAQIGVHTGERWSTFGLKLPRGIQCVIFTPSTPMSTEQARKLLPETIPRSDAIFNMSRTAVLVLSLCEGNLDFLKLATEDKLHQPYRGASDVMPATYPCINAALAAGADGAFLSGAGSSVLAVCSGLKGDALVQDSCERHDANIRAAMIAAAADVGVVGTVRTVNPVARGAHVVHCFGSDAPPPPRMRYRSTRSKGVGCTGVRFEDAIMRGLAPDGGLFVPEDIPKVTQKELDEWSGMTFTSLAVEVMAKFIGDDEIPRASLESIVTKSYANFSTSHVTPLVDMSDDGSVYVLEQFHGPTCAFKDVALQFLGNLFEFFLERASDNNIAAGKPAARITVLGATSGDTGSAAIEGLRGKNKVEVYILHPHTKVAPIQEAQMTTVLDANVHNVAVGKGAAFDDCQSMVKELFNDEEFRHKHQLAAVNSINWARIMAQIVYYFYGYFRWAEKMGKSDAGKKDVHFVVPTGNFGNALAGFYARSMGLPIAKLVVATNHNDILYRFLDHADYTAQPVQPSLAPAMDIVVPSNFERFLFWMFGNDCDTLARAMKEIRDTGKMTLGDQKAVYMEKIHDIFHAHRASDAEISEITQKLKQERNYLLCPHTATGMHGIHQRSALRTGGKPIAHIVMATAHPAKFGKAITECTAEYNPPLPQQLHGLLEREQRCQHISNIEELRALMDADLATRAAPTSQNKRPDSAPRPPPVTEAPGLGGGTVWPLLGAFAAGVLLTIALVKKHA
eukprot:m.71774 g.71774  ORF g.71774 m.71774 type:complete len:883 (-) comp16093_c0_seq5:273-2921(-)